jgi:hypothetical protein
MATIHVPRPPRSSRDPKRPASSLLLTQVEHMHTAEKRLPQRYQSGIYVNAIRTEGEAAEYIGAVTGAILQAHEDAGKRKTRSVPKPGRRLQIAAAADEKRSSTKKSRGAHNKSKSRSKK